MERRKTLQELTIKDNFMFGAVMSIEENCIGFLELVLGFPIARIQISKEKSMIYHPEYKGVRLDIYAEDENRTHYNVEMQVQKKACLGKRSRYYHSQMDMECLVSGTDYTELPDTFVIFICDFDPFGEGRYCYTFYNCCVEDKELLLEDGCQTIFLSTKGKNNTEVTEELIKFLRFVEADLVNSEADFQDKLVEKFQKSVQRIKTDREMGERYMIFEEMMRDERNEGREEGRKEGMLQAKQYDIFEILEDKWKVSEELREKIEGLRELEKLQRLHKAAARAESVESFEVEAEGIFRK